MANLKDGLFGSFEAARMIGISLERLRYWENLRIITPKYVRCQTRKYRRFSPQDIRRAVLVRRLVDEEKYSLQGAIKKLRAKGSPCR